MCHSDGCGPDELATAHYATAVGSVADEGVQSLSSFNTTVIGSVLMQGGDACGLHEFVVDPYATAFESGRQCSDR
jgi:hypothetical protein